MKITAIVVCLLFAFTANSYLFGLANANSAVIDDHGDEVQTGVPYYVMPVFFFPGEGGLALGRATDKPYLKIVVQRQSEIDFGIPVIFSNVQDDDVIVQLNSDVYVEFLPIRDKLCTTSTVWMVEDSKVTTGGLKGEVDSSRSPSWFVIEEYIAPVGGYTFNHCPSNSTLPVCRNIGKFVEDGQVRIGLTDYPARWRFVKATNVDELAGYSKQ